MSFFGVEKKQEQNLILSIFDSNSDLEILSYLILFYKTIREKYLKKHYF